MRNVMRFIVAASSSLTDFTASVCAILSGLRPWDLCRSFWFLLGGRIGRLTCQQAVVRPAGSSVRLKRLFPVLQEALALGLIEIGQEIDAQRDWPQRPGRIGIAG